jgi:uncharacterized membrane protein YhaH (DUF805 family)
MDLVYLFTSWQGRINRSGYWVGTLIILVVEVALRLALGIPFVPTPADAFSVRAAGFVIELILLYPAVMVMVKRLHDLDYSGQMAGVFVAPYAVLMITNLMGMSGDPNHIGVMEGLLLLATGVIAIAFLIELGFRGGIAGANAHGPETK